MVPAVLSATDPTKPRRPCSFPEPAKEVEQLRESRQTPVEARRTLDLAGRSHGRIGVSSACSFSVLLKP
jgi:hypothetical protein